MLDLIKLIHSALADGIKMWLGIKGNGERINKLQAEVQRLQDQFDQVDRRTTNQDLRIDETERTTTHLMTASEIIEGKITRAISNSEHALELIRKHNAN